MPWYLNVKTESEHHVIKFASEQDAKQALARARAEVFDHSEYPGGVATVEDQVVLPRSDVTSLTIHEAV